MEDINLFIKEHVKEIGNDIYVAPNIPEKKLNNAIKAFHCEDFYRYILAIYDDTLFGSAKEGLVFTGKRMIHHEYGEFIYSDIKSVEYVEINDDNNKDKYLLIITKDNKRHELRNGLTAIDKKKLADFLNDIIINFHSYKEEDQLKSIPDMPEELKIAYMKIIINMTYSDDNSIDEKELSELLLLMTRLEINREARFELRSYISSISKDNIEPVEKLLDIIKRYSEESLYKSIMISLVKDLINVYFSTKDIMTREFTFLDNYKDLFNLSDEEIEVAYQAIENDYRILKYDTDDDVIEQQAKELAAKAAAAGVPLGAIYISGSVIGLSAAGITSGLAALGLGLGMTGGLAVVGVLGVLSYKGVKYLTGSDEIDKYKHKELMLHEVIKQTQKTISLVIEDINYLVNKLNETIIKHSEQKEKIEKLMYMMAQYQGALSKLDKKADVTHGVIMRSKCPKILDKERLKSLTSETTKKPLYEFIINNYELKEVTENGEIVKRLVLKDNLSTEVLDKMAKTFQLIGYFDLSNTLKSKLMGFFK